MIAAILSAGPSLARTWDPIFFDAFTVYAVNSAAKLYQHDWLSAGDKCWFRGLYPTEMPSPWRGILTCPDSVTDARAWGRSVPVVGWDEVDLIGAHHRRGHPINWSLQAAMCHAAQNGAKLIRLYGVDLAGREDCAGYVGEDRTEDRWVRERLHLEQTTALLAEHGVTVERVTA